MNDLEFVKRMSAKPLWIEEYPVEVKDAGHKGLGLFTTRNVKKNEILAFYDGLYVENNTEAIIITGKRGYCIGTEKGIISGFPTPLRKGGNGQLSNDFKTNYTIDDFTNEKSDYYKNINAKHFWTDRQGGILLLTAIKDIKKGKEVLVSYGYRYWNEEKGEHFLDSPIDTFSKLMTDCGLTDNDKLELLTAYAKTENNMDGMRKREELFNKMTLLGWNNKYGDIFKMEDTALTA